MNLNVCLHQWQLPKERNEKKNWTHHHRPYNYSIQSIVIVCVLLLLVVHFCNSEKQKKRKKKRTNEENQFYVYLVAALQRVISSNFRSYLMVEVHSNTASTRHTHFQPARKQNPKRNQWIFSICLSHVIETNFIHLSTIRMCNRCNRCERQNRIYNETPLLCHVNICVQCAVRTRKNRVNFIAN